MHSELLRRKSVIAARGSADHSSFSQCPDRMFPVIAGHLAELVKNYLFLRPWRGVIPLRDRLDQFTFGCQTQLPPDSVSRHVETQRVTFS